MPALYAKETNERIIGTRERVYGTALASNFTVNEEGGFEPEYDGGTDIDWDSQETVGANDGRTLYVGEDGWLYGAHELELRDETDG